MSTPKTWNYRLIRHPADPRHPFSEAWIGLHEVYYDSDGEVVAWSEKPITFACDADEGREGIVKSLERALTTLATTEMLDVTTLPGWSAPPTPKVVGKITGTEYDGNQCPGMPEAICHACGLGYRCSNPDCPNEKISPYSAFTGRV